MTDNPFASTTLGRLTLKNHFIRSATWDGMGLSDGSFSPAQIELYRDLSRGGAGLLTTGYIAVTEQGRRNREQNLLCENRHTQSLRKVAEMVKREEAALVAQLVHCGGYAKTEISNLPLIAPDGKREPIFEDSPRAVTEAEIHNITTQFAEAAARAREAGCDGVQIHAAHGYLISQFLSPCTNHRRDEYGGSRENRARFLLEVYEKIRSYVGTDFTVTMKINGSDYFPDGLECADSLKITQQLAKLGLDGVEVSGGNPISKPLTPIPRAIKAGENEVPFQNEMLAFTESLPIPVAAVAGIRSLETAAELLKQKVALISLSRPLISEPDLIKQWQSGREEPSRCDSCNRCFIPAFKGKGIKCNKK